MDLQTFKSMIREKCGLCFEAEKEALLSKGIRTRMSERGMSTDSEYMACLGRNDDEFSRLINLVTINETYFFREPVHLDLLAEKCLPPMRTSGPTGDPIRILCAGCSTGEEVYSVMIRLLEKYDAGIGNQVSVTGVDIDGDALSRAEQGIYGDFSFRGFPDPLREKYFKPAGNDRYAVRDFVKEHVSFRKVNLKNDAFPDSLRDMNAIFYRNVSIYFKADTQRIIFDKLAGLLKEKGWLFVSATETLSHNYGTLSLVELDGVFCFQKNIDLSVTDRGDRFSPRDGQVPEAKDMAPKPRPVSRTPLPDHGRSLPPAQATMLPAADRHTGDSEQTGQALFDEALSLARTKNYEQALSRIDLLLGNDPSFAKGYMLKAGILINLKHLDEAEQVCRRSTELDQWSLEAHLLLGSIARLRGDGETAVKRFKEALYIQPSSWLAHFYLAELHEAHGDDKNAVREYEIVTKLLQRDDRSDHGLTFFPLAFPIEQVAHLCQYKLKKLTREIA